MSVPAVVVDRPEHTIVAGGENIGRVDIEIETDLYGEWDITRGSYSSILGEMDFPASLEWSVQAVREKPHKDDGYPMSMPSTIANLSIYAKPEEGLTANRPEEVNAMDINHLHVQEEARGKGYGQLMWDCHLALVAYGDYRSSGGVGASGDHGTVNFLKSQGVPESDLRYDHPPSSKTGITRWDTAPENVLSGVPIRHTTVDI